MDTATESPVLDKTPDKMSSECNSPPAFARLPDEIIQQILQLTDPNSFASLILLNSTWRRVSQQAHLYAHHLSRCPSYLANHGASIAASAKDEDLPKLRRLFAQEVKRNLFEAYLRPNTITIKLVSNSISSSSVPGGEGMQFSPSPRGHHLLAYNSSRIYVIDVRGSELVVKRELKILRRPVSTCILDDGTLLAVLSSDMQVELYDLTEHPPKRTQTLILDHTPRAIALSPCGSVLAAAYEGGIEVSSLRSNSISTERRAVKCDGVDSLAFSLDGTQLLGTTTLAQPPNTVVLTAPYYDPGADMGEDSISALWTTSILFPNSSRDCSHAVLLQESMSQEASWTITYDKSFETFRAVRIDDLRNGTTYFTGPIPQSSSQSTLLPCTLPAATYCGDLVSAGFEGKDVWLYGIPEDLEAVLEAVPASSDPAGSGSGLNRRNSAPSARSSPRMQESGAARVPQWQILCDRNRNTFVAGRKVVELTGVSTLKWIAGHGKSSLQERLIVAARGIQPPKPITEEDGIDFVDGGRITILDFDYSVENGKNVDITIEVGTKQPEILEEEHRDIATEVAIVRRRTVAQRGGRSGVMRSTTLAARQAETLMRPAVPPLPGRDDDDDDDPLIPRRMTGLRTESQTATDEVLEEPSLEDVQEALDAPYAHASPRSAPTLRRAATAAAVNRRLHPSAATGGRIQYRRADGRAEHPHESDADNWVPPPPPYAKEDPGDLPAFLRHAAIPGVTADSAPSAPPSAPPMVARPAPQLPSSSTARPELPRINTSTNRGGTRSSASGSRAPHQRIASDSTNRERLRPGSLERPASNPTSQSTDFRGQIGRSSDERAYEASPVMMPSQPAQRPYSQQYTGSSSERRVYTSPQTASTSTPSSGSQHTPYSAATGSSGGSARPHPLQVSIPAPQRASHGGPGNQYGSSPVVGQVPNAQTWPRVLQPNQSASAGPTSFPQSAPAANVNNAERIAASLQPAPLPRQLMSVHRHQDSDPPRRASGSFQLPRVPVGRNANRDRARSIPMRGQQQHAPPAPDEPLIISTPKGVSGSFDPPSHGRSHSSASEPIIHAPVPRHPRPTPGSGPLRPTAERLETIYSTNNGQARHGQPLTVPPPPPAPPSQLTSASLRHHTSLSRRQSRARRSAAKNVQDAKKLGWTGRRKKKQKKEFDAASNAWTDVTWASTAFRDGQSKEKKCVIM
ncbi:hypothetical protein BX600DRAFT_453268 [Xylariales sp. PMI_506]|nr:hypothetical protein BX600DRAFT_453268 [Xylariales sp. PMI_506]